MDESKPPQKPASDRRGPKQPPSPADLTALRRAGEFSLLLILGVVFQWVDLPLRLVTGAFALAAIVAGVIALRAARRARRAPLNLGLVIVGFLMAGLLLVQVGTEIAFYSQSVAYQDCRNAAITTKAQDACAKEYRSSIESLTGKLLPGS